MPNTSKGLPYPAPTDTPDVPRDMQALAQAAGDLILCGVSNTPFAANVGTVPIPAGYTLVSACCASPQSLAFRVDLLPTSGPNKVIVLSGGPGDTPANIGWVAIRTGALTAS